MSNQFKLISHELCPYAQRAKIVLDEKSIDHELEYIDLTKPPTWFLALSPLGKVPLLLVNGRPLFESAVIVEYLDEATNGSLHPLTLFDKARNRAWIEVASEMLATIGGLYSVSDKRAMDKKIEALNTQLDLLENTLDHGPYFNGDQFSLVDAAFAPAFRYFDVIDKYRIFDFFENRSKVRNWREILRQRPSVIRAVKADYAKSLEQFLMDRNSALSRVMRKRQAA